MDAQVLLVLERIDGHRPGKTVVVISFLSDHVQPVGVDHEAVEQRTGRDLWQGIPGAQRGRYHACVSGSEGQGVSSLERF